MRITDYRLPTTKAAQRPLCPLSSVLCLLSSVLCLLTSDCYTSFVFLILLP
jgi:hypothetical protein